MQPERRFLSLHAHVSGHENAFLRQVLVPALAALPQAPAACFFLRYWQGGPHLRLRVRASPAQQAALLTQIEGRFGIWSQSVGEFTLPDAAEHAAMARRFAALEGVPGEVTMLASPALIPSAYVAEAGKYGGDCGLDIAEQVWHASSAVVLAANDANQLQGARRAHHGLHMALLAVRAFGLSVAQAAQFFGGCAQVWQAYCPGPASVSLEQRLLAQAGALQPMLAALWEGDEGRDAWSVALRLASQRILEQASPIADAMGGAMTRLPAARIHQYLLSQYLHTNNNRLGINPADEWLQARLAQATLAQYDAGSTEFAHV
jgi:thiopeptide-type bacteriocin biosynthesis protein